MNFTYLNGAFWLVLVPFDKKVVTDIFIEESLYFLPFVVLHFDHQNYFVPCLLKYIGKDIGLFFYFCILWPFGLSLVEVFSETKSVILLML